MVGHMADYRMPLSSFLNDEADRGIQLDEQALQHRRDLFEKALRNVCYYLPPTGGCMIVAEQMCCLPLLVMLGPKLIFASEHSCCSALG